MVLRREKKFWHTVILCICLLTACDQKIEKKKVSVSYVPVTALEISQSRISQTAELTGSLLPWKEADLKFQVSGRIGELYVKTPGEEVRGELKDKSGQVLYRGDVIAELDDTPYRLALEEAEAQLDVVMIKLEAAKKGLESAIETINAAQARVDSTLSEIEKVYPIDMKIAEENRKYGEKTFALVQKVHGEKGTTDSRMLQAQTEMLVAQANEEKARLAKILKEKQLQGYRADLAKARVQEKLQQAQIKIAEAQIRQAKAAAKRAREDLDKCKLRAPFNGVVSNIYAIPGILVNTQVAIARLVMMDPIRIDVAVSFKRLRDFTNFNEFRIYPYRRIVNNSPRFEDGYLYHIQTTADPSSRTFLATLLARNYQEDLADYSTYNTDQYKKVAERNFSIPVRKNPDGTGSIYVDVRCLDEENGETYVWKVSKEEPVSRIEKMKVELGPGLESVITWLFREVKSENIEEGDILLAIHPDNNSNLKEELHLQSDDRVFRPRRDWLYRPGELVKVRYERHPIEGMFLPSEAILHSHTGEFAVLIIHSLRVDEEGFEVGYATRRKILKRQIDNLWKIEGGVSPGDLVVIHGSHHVDDRYTASEGQDVPIRIVRRETLPALIQGYHIKEISE